MKQYMIETLVIFIFLVTIPFLSLLSTNNSSDTPSKESTTVFIQEEDENTSTNGYDNTGNDEIDVLRVSSGKIETVSKSEYLIGVVASEMPASFHEEALKAQAVASNTYLKWIINNNNSDSKEDITDSSSSHQGYLDKESMKEKWGETFEKYYSKLEKIIKEVEKEYLTYNGKIALAAFHALSSGITNSAKDVWNQSIPYLDSVTAPGDKLSSDLDSTKTFEISELKKIIIQNTDDDSEDEKNSFSLSTVVDSGYVAEADAFGKILNGEELKSILSLKSPNFTVEIKDKSIVFKVKGKGHGVGMSQYSADFMARQGSSYKEILSHFYKGTELVTE